jgi:hypothetical protein
MLGTLSWPESYWDSPDQKDVERYTLRHQQGSSFVPKHWGFDMLCGVDFFNSEFVVSGKDGQVHYMSNIDAT